MAFKFNWPDFTTEFIEQAKQLLTTALNKSNKPANIVDHIVVKDLNMGTKPPELEVMEIGELAVDKFKGIFKLIYSGDAHLTLQTKVQANPMNNNKSDVSIYTRRGILAADQPLVVPMLLRLSNLKLRGIFVLVVSKQKGITLAFKSDPLEKIDVTSTFDSISTIQRFLQNEIEKRLRTMFQEDLPSIVHQLSLQKFVGLVLVLNLEIRGTGEIFITLSKKVVNSIRCRILHVWSQKEINAAFSIGKILPIDTNLVDELEKQAQGIFKDVETMFQHLQSQMFEATVLTKSSFEVYDQTIVKQGEAIETAIDKTKQLIELCVDLDKEFNRLKQSLGLQDAGNIAQQRACEMVKRICTKTSMEVRELIDFYEKVEIWFEKWVA
ncbi:10976_t:CDS:2 [Entrophospora sp. SA101]|nr:10976_t:CDS:2 [Entrophospora sp. SA101]